MTTKPKKQGRPRKPREEQVEYTHKTVRLTPETHAHLDRIAAELWKGRHEVYRKRMNKTAIVELIVSYYIQQMENGKTEPEQLLWADQD